jgi:hypothetical protein
VRARASPSSATGPGQFATIETRIVFLRIAHDWVKSQHAPLYELTFPAFATDEEVIELCSALERWHDRSHHPYAWVFDLSRIREAPPLQRQLFREHMQRISEHDAKFHHGVGLVVPNGFLRGLVTATFWFVPPTFPHEAFPTRREAFDFAQGKLVAAELAPFAGD